MFGLVYIAITIFFGIVLMVIRDLYDESLDDLVVAVYAIMWPATILLLIVVGMIKLMQLIANSIANVIKDLARD
jgi:hypothetical protein